MSDQFYQPAPGDLVACDDGLHFILLDEANAHCNWVMRLHPDGGLVSVRKATEHELAHAKARQHLRAGVAQLEVSEGQLPERQETKAGEPDLVAYHCVDQYGQKKVLLPGAEGIRRHILHGSVLKQLTYMDTACRLLAERDALQQRLAEAEKRAGALAAFAIEMVSASREGGSFDAGDIQDMAVKHGLLVIEPRQTECGEYCACSEYGFPSDCYRNSLLLASPPRSDGEQPS